MKKTIHSKQADGCVTKTVNGLIVADRMTEGKDPFPCTLLKVCGISLLERQVRQLRNIGISRIVVLASDPHPGLVSEIEGLTKLNVDIRLHRFGRPPEMGATPADWMLMDGAALIDFRLPRLIKEKPGEQVAVAPAVKLDPADAARAVAPAYVGKPMVFAGCARLNANRILKLESGNGNGPLDAVLSDALRESGGAAVDITELPIHIHDMRRDLPYYWIPVTDEADCRRAKALLIDASHKDVVDWPARFIHRPIENRIVKLICEWPITPNQITLICNIVAYWAAYHFAFGSARWALLGALAVGVLDGVDGMQARVKQMMSRIGGVIEHVCDSLYEYVWQYAIAYRLMTEGHGAVALWMACFIVGVDMAEKVLLNLFERKRAMSLNVYSPFDRAFRMVVGRRDTYMWALIPFVLFDALWAGYRMLVAYAFITLLERAWRVGYILYVKR